MVIVVTTPQDGMCPFCPFLPRHSRLFPYLLSHPALRSVSDFPRFILGFGISCLLRIDFQCTGFIPQFFNLMDAVAFGDGFGHRFVRDVCGWLRFCWHGVLVPAHASLRCGSSSNRFHTFARDIHELPSMRASPDICALPDTHASLSWLKFSSFSLYPRRSPFFMPLKSLSARMR